MPNPNVIAGSFAPASRFSKSMTFAMIFAAGILLGCSGDGNDTPSVNAVAVVAETVDFYFDASCNAAIEKPVDSRWSSKLERLSNLDGQYELKTRGPVNLDHSLFTEPQTLAERPHIDVALHVSNLEVLLGQMKRAESVFIKGTNDLGGHLYPRATIEEYVFNSLDCAETAESYLHWIEDSVGTRSTRWKDMARIFRDNQSVYYLTGGGAYMSDRMPVIETALKEAGK